MLIPKSLIAFLLLTLGSLTLRTAHAQAQTQTSEGAQQFADLGDFRLQSGEVIHNFRLAYRSFGQLNADKSNAILWPTWLGGTTQDLLQFVGPGKVVDSTKYYVVLVDAIGNSVSASPSNSKEQPGMKFPKITIRDMVESEHRLATETLRLSHLHAVMGISMGGMQTFSWVLNYPDFLDVAIPMFGSPQSTSYDKLLWTAEIDAIQSDPAWNHGNPTDVLTRGIALSEEIDSMNLTSPEYRVAHTDENGFPQFVKSIHDTAKATGGTAWNQIRQREAIIGLDLPHDFDTTLEQCAKRVHAKMLIVVSPQDHMVNPIPATKFAAAGGFPVLTLDSPCGHISLDCISAGPTVARFLADPTSVHSTTLNH